MPGAPRRASPWLFLCGGHSLLSHWSCCADARQPGQGTDAVCEGGPSLIQALTESSLQLRQSENSSESRSDTASPQGMLREDGVAVAASDENVSSAGYGAAGGYSGGITGQPLAPHFGAMRSSCATCEFLRNMRGNDGRTAGWAPEDEDQPRPFEVDPDMLAMANVVMILCLGSAALAIASENGFTEGEQQIRASLYEALVAASVSGVAGVECFAGRLLHAHGALLALHLVLGVRGIVLKLSIYDANPLAITSAASACAAVALTATSLARRVPLSVPTPDAVSLVFGGVMLAFSQLAFATGMKIQDATSAMCWQPGVAIFTSAFAIICGYERISPVKAVGFLVAACGVLFSGALIPTEAAHESAEFANLCFLVGCYTLAAYILLAKELVSSHHFMAVATWTSISASVMAILITALAALQPDTWLLHCWAGQQDAMQVCMGNFLSVRAVPPLCLLFLAACAVAMPVSLCFAAQHVKPSVVGVYSICQPVSAVAATGGCVLAFGDWSIRRGVPLPNFGVVPGSVHVGSLLAFVLVEGSSGL